MKIVGTSYLICYQKFKIYCKHLKILFNELFSDNQPSNSLPGLPERPRQLVDRLGVHLRRDHWAALLRKGRQLGHVVHHHHAKRRKAKSFWTFRRRRIGQKSFPAVPWTGEAFGPNHRRASHLSKCLKNSMTSAEKSEMDHDINKRSVWNETLSVFRTFISIASSDESFILKFWNFLVGKIEIILDRPI